MSRADHTEPEFTLDEHHLQHLKAVGEHFAAGFFSRPEAPIVVRIAEGLRHLARDVLLPEYRGEKLYPTGPAYWSRLFGNQSIVSWHYVRIEFNENVLAEKKKTATPEQAAALDALVEVWRDYPAPRGYTHSIPHYDRVLAEGLDGFARRITEKKRNATPATDPGASSLYEALEITLDAAHIIHRRCIDAISQPIFSDPDAVVNQKALTDAYSRVPLGPARSYREAMIATNFILYFDGCDNLGRFDQFMQPYIDADIVYGKITRDEALAYVRQLWKNIDDAVAWNVALGGSKSSGEEASNDMTLLALKAAQGRRRPNLALRLRKDTPDHVWDAAFDTIASGCGLPALYCEENYLQALREARLNVPEDDVCRFAFGGCTELMVHGCSNVGSVDGDINLLEILVKTLHAQLAECGTFEELLAAYKQSVAEFHDTYTAAISRWQQLKARYHPQPIRSLLVDDCIENGREFAAGGARYNWSVLNVMGLANVVDSLCAVRELVFEKQELTAPELLAALEQNFAGNEQLRRRMGRCPRYGNGNEAADELAREVSAFVFNDLLRRAPWRGGRFLPACLMFVMFGYFGENIGASPDARLAGTPIADSAGPVSGRDIQGPTAMLRSVSDIDQMHAPGTLVVNARFARKYFTTPATREKLKSLIRSYFDMGGMQLQINVVDQATLQKAAEQPEDYGDLIIRVGGYSEYWKNLTADLRESILERTEH